MSQSFAFITFFPMKQTWLQFLSCGDYMLLFSRALTHWLCGLERLRERVQMWALLKLHIDVTIYVGASITVILCTRACCNFWEIHKWRNNYLHWSSFPSHAPVIYHWKICLYHDQLVHQSLGTSNRRVECFDVSLYNCITLNHRLHGTCFA
jgi:hypothetical protein